MKRYLSPVSPVVPFIAERFERVLATLPFFPLAQRSSPVSPPRSRDSSSIISFFYALDEEIEPLRQWSSCKALDIPRNPVGNGSRPSVVVEIHHVHGLPYFDILA
ncbi:hypothetical protein KIN20_023260 [Parelaphostrongylus tenuis]|uniref:Uncharacterized protein n=1 Tax=Parelaphostrongylus tenuis TaxID=148309 RepID=A0AAD5QXA1_PARTN|nr:hypothetical protein KIN20_023260 [Parelaphostrongylus tenuis]